MLQYASMRSGWLIALFSSLFLLAIPVTHGQSADAEKLADAQTYLSALEKAVGLPVEKQVQVWQQFLEEHPSHRFREEIESNVRHLSLFLQDTDPQQKKEKRDTEVYLKAVEFAKRLSGADEVALWEQFLEENPKNIFIPEVQTRLSMLHRQLIPAARPQTKPKAKVAPPAKIPVVRRLPYKDPQKAVLLATFPGLIVPGLGHWYSEDYILAGILTGVRAGGLAVGIPGVIQRNTPMTIAGAVVVGFSYLVDVIDAPFSVRRYNGRLEQASSAKGGMLQGAPFDVVLAFAF